VKSEDASRITLGHGAGGRLTADLVREVFLRRLGNDFLSDLGDSALLPAAGWASSGAAPGAPDQRLAFTTDGFVVTPLFFPGGDIGKLAVCGTVNDLAVAGAEPAHLAASFIIEEGLPLADLELVVDSMARAARDAGVAVVTGASSPLESAGAFPGPGWPRGGSVRETASSSTAPSASTAWPSSRGGRESSLRPRCRATAHRCPG